MIGESIFVCGKGVLSHPVSFLFHLGVGTAHGVPTAKSLGDSKRLVLADCRNAKSADVASWTETALAAGKPVLLLCPSLDTIEALKGKVGILPTSASAALLVASHKNPTGLMNFDVRSLEYALFPTSSETVEGPSELAKQNGKKPEAEPQLSCVCTDFETLTNAFVSPESAEHFKCQVEKLMDHRYKPVVLDTSPPTGLKYFLNTFTPQSPFTYSCSGNSNGSGTIAFTWTVWGFLNQTATSNSQYLVVDARISLSPGSLYSNDECNRSYGNAALQGTLTAPMSPQAFVPTSGNGSFSGTVTIPISYKSPTGGYQIWTFTDSMSNTVDSWSCTTVSAGSALGGYWWMTSPCDGSNLSGSWSDAFNTWGHVGDLTSASTGSLDVNSISAWVSNNILSGYQSVNGSFSWTSAGFWGSSCSPGLYWKINACWPGFNWSPGFSVDFTPIQPS
jgi:hypothetical protein